MRLPRQHGQGRQRHGVSLAERIHPWVPSALNGFGHWLLIPGEVALGGNAEMMARATCQPGCGSGGA